MGKLARLEDALLLDQTEQLVRNHHRRQLANAGRQQDILVKECGLELDDFMIYKFASSGGHPEHSTSPCDSDAAYSGSSPQSPSQQAATRRSDRTPKPSKRARDDDDDSPPNQPPKRSKGHDDDGDDDGDDGGDDDDDDEDAGPVSWQQKKAKKSAPRRQPSDHLQKAQPLTKPDEFAASAAPYLQSTDPALRNARRIANHLNKIKLARKVKPLVTDKSETTIAQRLTQAAAPGKSLRPMPGSAGQERQSSKASGKLLTFKFWMSKQNKEEPGSSIGVPVGMLPNNYSASDLDNLHAELARLHNTWSWGKGPDDHVKQLWVEVALANIFAAPRQLPLAKHNNSTSYKTTASYIDAKTGKVKILSVTAAATDQMMGGVTVPALPDLDLVYGANQVVRSTIDSPRHIAAPDAAKLKLNKNTTSRAAQHKAEDALYWLALQVQGLIATEDRVKELYVQARREIGLPKPSATKEGIYGGESDLWFFSYSRKQHWCNILPTKKVSTDLSSTPMALRLIVYSLNASRCTPVMETILQLFSSGRDIRYTWLEAAKIADTVNLEIASGVPPSSVCDCDDNQALTEYHICQGCARPALCQSRQFDSLGRLVCQSCHNRDAVNTNGGLDPSDSLAAYYARSSLRTSFKRECASRKITFDDVQTVFADAWESLKADLPGKGKKDDVPADDATRFTDTWTGKLFDLTGDRALVGNNPSRKRVLPHGLVVDAVHQIGHPKNRGLKHSANNLVVTVNACNMAKGEFPVGILHEIGSFLRRGDRDTDAAREALVQKIQTLTVVQTKKPYIKKGQGSDRQKYEKIIAELVSGKPTPGEQGHWETHAQRYVQRAVPPYKPKGRNNWDDATWNKAQQCAMSIEKYFGVQLLRLKDGTCWIGTESSNPPNLHRNGIAVLCHERHLRMRLECNKNKPTLDTPLTLYREILFQYCASRTTKPELQALRAEYGDRLGLPICMWINNPLRFSVAHRRHGFAMWSGWLDEDATQVSERDDTQNNLLIESWFVNHAKMDIPEDYYDQLDEILRNLSVPTKFYNPNAQPVNNGAVPFDGEIDEQEEELVLEFNADVVTAEDDSKDEATGGDKTSKKADKKADKKTDKKADKTAVKKTGNDADDESGREEDESVDEEDQSFDEPAGKDVTMTDAPGGYAGDEDEEMPMAPTAAPTSDPQLDSQLSTLYGLIIGDDTQEAKLQYQPEVQRLLAQLRSLADEGDDATFQSIYQIVMEDYLFPNPIEHEQE